AKQRVARCQHLMERQAGLELEAERRLGADQVHLMTPLGQRLSELGRDDTAPADRRIADHADVHWTSLTGIDRPIERHRASHARSRWGLTTGSRTTIPSANETPTWAPNWASLLSMSRANVADVRRVATASAAAGRNCVAWHASARRLVS